MLHYYRKPYPKRLITAGFILTNGDVLSPPAQNGAGGDSRHHRRFLLRPDSDRYNGHHRRFVTGPGGDRRYEPAVMRTPPHIILSLSFYFFPNLILSLTSSSGPPPHL